VNILDENIIDSQRQRLRHWRIAVRHMGYDVARQGMQDHEIIALLHRLRRPILGGAPVELETTISGRRDRNNLSGDLHANVTCIRHRGDEKHRA